MELYRTIALLSFPQQYSYPFLSPSLVTLLFFVLPHSNFLFFVLRMLLLLIPAFSNVQQVMRAGMYLYNIIVAFIARGAGLGSGRPEVKPSTPRPLPVWLKELAGKSGG